MTRRRSLLLATLAATTALVAPPLVAPVAAEPVKAVASFSILGDMVRNVGGDHVELTTIVGPDGDTHVYEPTPADARAIADADVVFVNGLEFEGWIDRLLEASGYTGPVVTATAGIDRIPLEDGHDDAEYADHEEHDGDHAEHEADEDEHHAEKEADHDAHEEHEEEHAGHGDREEADHAEDEGHHHHGEFDPHAWHDLANARIYVDNIEAGLAEVDPEHAATYEANAAAYGEELAALDADVHAMLDDIPDERRKVVTSHDAFQYFGRAYGIEFLAPVGMSTEAEPSAGEIADLIRHIRDEGIAAVFVENITDPRLIEQITAETDAEIGGTLYSGALSGPDGPAPTYLEMFRHNASLLAGALAS